MPEFTLHVTAPDLEDARKRLTDAGVGWLGPTHTARDGGDPVAGTKIAVRVEATDPVTARNLVCGLVPGADVTMSV